MVFARVLEDEPRNSRLYLEDLQRGGSVTRVDWELGLISRNVDFSMVGNILQIGCGHGLISYSLARRNPSALVVGTDIWETVLRYARLKNDLRNLRFEIQDAYALDIPDCSYDITLCALVIHHLADPKKAVEEMVRVTRPGGQVYVVDFTRDIGLDQFSELVKLEQDGTLEHDLLSASIRASLSREEYEALAGGISGCVHEQRFYSMVGPNWITIRCTGWRMTKHDF
jgi:ubiquinone/menaquinone biosynthesis C-methylase UbiE